MSTPRNLPRSIIPIIARRGRMEKGHSDPASVELNTMVFKLAVGPDAAARRDALAREIGMAVADLRDSTLFLTGSAPEVRERLLEYRARVGLTYFSLFDPGPEQIEYLAEHVVAPLTSAR